MSKTTSEDWVRDYENPRGLEYTEHLGGVVWCDAPAPRKWHKHTAQTRAFIGAPARYVERCACGAFGPDPWVFLDRPRVRGWFATRGTIGAAVLALALTACGGAAQPATPSPSSSSGAAPAPGGTTCDAATEAILTGSEADIKAAFAKLVADKSANKTAREYARSYLGPDAGPYGKDARDTDVALIQMACGQ